MICSIMIKLAKHPLQGCEFDEYYSSMKIDYLSKRVKNSLSVLGICTTGQLIDLLRSQNYKELLMRIPNFGKTSLQEIESLKIKYNW